MNTFNQTNDSDRNNTTSANAAITPATEPSSLVPTPAAIENHPSSGLSSNAHLANEEVPMAKHGKSPRPARDATSAGLSTEDVTPWPENVNAAMLLDELTALLVRFVVLPPAAPPALALWILHTYAFQLRDVTTYIGIESPEKQCGKTTLLTVLNELVNRAVTASNVSPPAFFRVIEDLAPTLLIDEGDTFLRGNDQLRGILNAGYKKKTAFVLRAGPAGSAGVFPGGSSGADTDSATPEAVGKVSRFSCWCPKVIATIGRLPDTLADRCILIRMQRKTALEQCERLRELNPLDLRQKCARFVLDYQRQIAAAAPALPKELSDRAAEIWEPLLAIADLAGGHWPELARKSALSLSASSQDSNPIASLLLDMFIIFTELKQDRLFSRELVQELSTRTDRPWMDLKNGHSLTDRWLSQQLRPYGIRPRTLRKGDIQAKGYHEADCMDVFRRYITRADLDALRSDPEPPPGETPPA